MASIKRNYLKAFLIVLIIKLLFFTPFEVKKYRINEFEYHSVFFTSNDSGNQGIYNISYSKSFFELLLIVVVFYLIYLVFDSRNKKLNTVLSRCTKMMHEKINIINERIGGLFSVNIQLIKNQSTSNSQIGKLEDETLDLFFSNYGYLFPFKDLSSIRNRIAKLDQIGLIEIENIKFKNTYSSTYTSIFMGFLGFDRMILNQFFSGFLKLISFILFIISFSSSYFNYEITIVEKDLFCYTISGIVGIWYLYDLATISKRIQKYNNSLLNSYLDTKISF